MCPSVVNRPWLDRWASGLALDVSPVLAYCRSSPPSLSLHQRCLHRPTRTSTLARCMLMLPISPPVSVHAPPPSPAPLLLLASPILSPSALLLCQIPTISPTSFSLTLPLFFPYYPISPTCFSPNAHDKYLLPLLLPVGYVKSLLLVQVLLESGCLK